MTRHTFLALGVLVPAIVLASGARAQAVQITFEDVPAEMTAMFYVNGNFVPSNARLSDQLQSSAGVTFSSKDASYVALVGLDEQAVSLPNGIGGVNGANALDYDAKVVITFTLPGDPSTPAVTNFVSIRGDRQPGGGSVTMEAFDVNGVRLGEGVTAVDEAGFTLELTRANIHSIHLTQDPGSLIAFDDLVFNPLTRVGPGNIAPVANAGHDKGALVGDAVTLDGSESYDPDGDRDLLKFSWTLTTPVGSKAVLARETTDVPTFTPDVPGPYTAMLTVSDPFGGVATASVVVAVITGAQFAENQVVVALDLIGALTPGQVTTRGNQNALQRFLTQVIVALQAGDLDEARDRLTKTTARTDGCALQGVIPDGNGHGRDWVTDCATQKTLYAVLTAALAALTP